MSIEPFGYFRADIDGWTDCHDDDEGAIPLWDSAALMAVEKQRDDLQAALVAFRDGGPEGGQDFKDWHDSYKPAISLARAAISCTKGGAA